MLTGNTTSNAIPLRNLNALILDLYPGEIPEYLSCLTTVEKSLISLINLVKHSVSDVASEFSVYGKSFSKVYALLNNVSNIAKQLPNMEAL